MNHLLHSTCIPIHTSEVEAPINLLNLFGKHGSLVLAPAVDSEITEAVEASCQSLYLLSFKCYEGKVVI